MSFKGPCPAVAPALLALLWLSAVPASASAAADSAPNIVFILADDLGEVCGGSGILGQSEELSWVLFSSP